MFSTANKNPIFSIMNEEYHTYGQHHLPHYRNRLAAAERTQIARYALYAIIIVAILVLHLTAVTTYGGAIIAWDHLARLAEREQATNAPPPKAEAVMDAMWNEFQKNETMRKRKAMGSSASGDN